MKQKLSSVFKFLSFFCTHPFLMTLTLQHVLFAQEKKKDDSECRCFFSFFL